MEPLLMLEHTMNAGPIVSAAKDVFAKMKTALRAEAAKAKAGLKNSVTDEGNGDVKMGAVKKRRLSFGPSARQQQMSSSTSPGEILKIKRKTASILHQTTKETALQLRDNSSGWQEKVPLRRKGKRGPSETKLLAHR